jgi:hypothetical protein
LKGAQEKNISAKLNDSMVGYLLSNLGSPIKIEKKIFLQKQASSSAE